LWFGGGGRLECVSGDFNRVRTTWALNDLSRLGSLHLKRLLAVGAFEYLVHASFKTVRDSGLAGRVENSIAGVTQARHNELVIVEFFIDHTSVNFDLWKFTS
jgi:hypothetical protein